MSPKYLFTSSVNRLNGDHFSLNDSDEKGIVGVCLMVIEVMSILRKESIGIWR